MYMYYHNALNHCIGQAVDPDLFGIDLLGRFFDLVFTLEFLSHNPRKTNKYLYRIPRTTPWLTIAPFASPLFLGTSIDACSTLSGCSMQGQFCRGVVVQRGRMFGFFRGVDCHCSCRGCSCCWCCVLDFTVMSCDVKVHVSIGRILAGSTRMHFLILTRLVDCTFGRRYCCF